MSVGIRLAMKYYPLRLLHGEVRAILEQGAGVAMHVAPNPMRRWKKYHKVKWQLKRLKGVEQVSIQRLLGKI